MNEPNSSLEGSANARPLAVNPNWEIPAWVSQLIKCNPFYLVSALLLVYGIYRLSVEPHFLRSDTAQTWFNFGAIQMYELMLAGTAVLLARRSIVYDSALLFWLENFLVLIPFMLLSHAVFLAPGMAGMICSCALFLVALRYLTFRFWLKGVELPTGLLALGGIVLLVNVALPLVFRQGLQTDNEIWGMRSRDCWLFILPFLLSLGNLLPRRRAAEGKTEIGLAPSWLYLLWILGTATHLWTIGYVDEQKFTIGDLSVLIWAAAWFFCYRADDLVPEWRVRGRILLVPPLATLLSLGYDRTEIFLWLNVVNMVVFSLLFLRTHARPIALLGLGSGMAAFLALPPEMIAQIIPHYSHGKLAVGLLALAGIYWSIHQRDPKTGMLGAFSAAVLCLGVAHGRPEFALHAAAQVGCVYFLLHGLFWKGPLEMGTNLASALASIVWLLDTLALTMPAGQPEAYLPFLMAAVALATLVVAWTVWRRHSWFATIGSVCVLSARPIIEIVTWTAHTPAGVLALIGSFALFAVGTYFAVSHNRVPTK